MDDAPSARKMIQLIQPDMSASPLLGSELHAQLRMRPTCHDDRCCPTDTSKVDTRRINLRHCLRIAFDVKHIFSAPHFVPRVHLKNKITNVPRCRSASQCAHLQGKLAACSTIVPANLCIA